MATMIEPEGGAEAAWEALQGAARILNGDTDELPTEAAVDLAVAMVTPVWWDAPTSSPWPK